jgi:hypothetical protein
MANLENIEKEINKLKELLVQEELSFRYYVVFQYFAL